MTQTALRSRLPNQLAYIETTIPAGMTIAEYRRSRPQRKPRRNGLRRWVETVAAAERAAS